MKKLIFVVLAVSMFLNHGKSQIQMDFSGNVAIGSTTPDSYKLRIQGLAKIRPGTNGTIIIDNSGYSSNPAIYGGAHLGKSNYNWYAVYATYVYETSDLRQKENIRSLTNSLDLVLQLNGVKYDYIKGSVALNSIMGAGANEEMVDSARKDHVGLIAQDVKKVIPEVVGYDDSTDIYSIDYTKFTPYLVEAIKEQQIIIESLQSEIESLKSEISGESTLKSASIPTSSNELASDKTNSLYQNSPNPFSESTKLEYYLTKEAKNAMICIYDMNGKQLKCFTVLENGYGYITIKGEELQAGMFMYTLIAEGQVVDTKRMILTD